MVKERKGYSLPLIETPWGMGYGGGKAVTSGSIDGYNNGGGMATGNGSADGEVWSWSLDRQSLWGKGASNGYGYG